MKEKVTYILFLLFAAVSPLCAQGDDAALYLSEAAESALLWRGKQAMPYSFAFNGTYYLYPPKFQPGNVAYNGKIYNGVEMNVDAYAQQLLIRPENSVNTKIAIRDHVEAFELDGRKYMNPQKYGISDLPEGFYEVLWQGEATVLRSRVKLLRDNSEAKRSLADYSGPYRPGVGKIFIVKETIYHIDAAGSITRIKNRSALYNCYKSRKRDIKRHVRGVEGDRILPLDMVVTTVMNFVEGGR